MVLKSKTRMALKETPSPRALLLNFVLPTQKFIDITKTTNHLTFYIQTQDRTQKEPDSEAVLLNFILSNPNFLITDNKTY